MRTGKKHGPGLIVLGRLSMPRDMDQQLITDCSVDPDNSIRTGDMAGPTIELEIRVDRKIRGSTCS